MAGTGCAMLPWGLSGCVSTQQKASWLHIEDARAIAAQTPTLVRTENPDVRVEQASVLRRGATATFVVRLRNAGRRTLVDLPISVGLERHGHRLYVNRAANLPYFDTHVAVVPAHQVISWVFSARMARSSAGHAFALVGPHSVPGVSPGRTMPDLRVALAGRHGGQLWVRVTNHSWVPQPQLRLYAVALKGRRVTGAARASVADLAGGQTVRVELGPSGQLRPDVQLEALPTMFLP